jgi:hypothetical protein
MRRSVPISLGTSDILVGRAMGASWTGACAGAFALDLGFLATGGGGACLTEGAGDGAGLADGALGT